MKKYRLKKDLPEFKAGEIFVIPEQGGGLWLKDNFREGNNYCGGTHLCEKKVLETFPNILTDWFEEIPEEPKTVWDLECGDVYYFIDPGESASKDTWAHMNIDVTRRETGNCFLAREDAEKELARRKAKVILERDTKGFKPDWQDGVQDRFEVYYDYEDNALHPDCACTCTTHNDLWFRTEADAKASIKVHEKEWKTYLGVYE